MMSQLLFVSYEHWTSHSKDSFFNELYLVEGRRVLFALVCSIVYIRPKHPWSMGMIQKDESLTLIQGLIG